ncbi:Brefeldin A-inhibited guanine nucleotide-exchange protein 2, partial [Monoraphidium neglectum]
MAQQGTLLPATAGAARPAAAELIGTSLARLVKLCGRDKKLAPVAAAAKELQDHLNEVLGPGAGAISDAAALAVLRVLRLAITAGKPPLVEVSLDLMHKLIALRFLQGAAHSVAAERDGGEGKGEKGRAEEAEGAAGGRGGAGSVSDVLAQTPQAVAVELICRCDEIPDEGVEVLVLRGLLTATTSTTFSLHGQALLLAVRTCYNIHLMSRSEVNQTTAKASLTQMLNVVFQRMEADSMMVQVKPIAVADMLSLAKGGMAAPQDASGVTPAVQNFLNSVISMTGCARLMLELASRGTYPSWRQYGGPTAQQQADALRSSVAAQFTEQQGEGGAPGGPSAATPSQPPGPPPQLAPPSPPPPTAAADEGGAAAAAAGPAGASSASSEASEEDDRERFKLAAAPARAAASDAQGKAEGGGGTAQGHSSHHSAGLLLKDAFLVFRALCKLSIRTSDSATVLDPTAARGKLLALELLKVLLENSGPTFRGSEKFTAAIRQYLCLSLLKNSASSIPAALQLSASIFLSLLLRFRAALKAEVGVFFPMILLKCLEPPTPGSAAAPAASAPGGPAINSYSYKVVVLRCLREVCCEGQLLVDLFVNYDCDLNSSNIFERLINGLVKMAQAPLTQGADHTAVQQEQWLRQEALQCLSSAAEGLLTWYNAATQGQLGHDDAGSDDDEAAASQSGAPPRPPRVATPTAAPDRDGAADALSAGGTAAGAAGMPAAGPVSGDALSRKRALKEKWHEGVALFNKKPKKGIALLQSEGMLGPSPEDIAAFLAKTEGLDKTTIGDYLGEREDMALKVMHAYVDAMDFSALEFDTAIRTFLQGFRLPGEAQKIDRLMEKFAARYISCNPG